MKLSSLRLLALAMSALVFLAATDDPLAAYRDKNRVVLVFAPTEQDPVYREQTRIWQGEKAGFAERQLIVLPVLTDAKKSAGDLAKKFDVDPGSFAVVLVGKDGHDAFRSAKPVVAPALYAVIDAMPMRRVEMKRQAAPPAKPDLDHRE